MKFSLVFIGLVAHAKASQDVLGVTSDMIYVPQETKYTFNVLATEEPTDTISDAALVNGCLESSYNAIHDPTKYFIQAIIPQSEAVVPVPPAGSASIGTLRAAQKSCKLRVLECIVFLVSASSPFILVRSQVELLQQRLYSHVPTLPPRFPSHRSC